MDIVEELKKIAKEKNLISIWDTTPSFEIRGMETYDDSFNEQGLENVKTLFEQKKIKIIYNKTNILIAVYICAGRCEDLYFNWTEVKIDRKKIKFKEEIDISEELIKNIDEIIKTNEITILCKSDQDYRYAKSVLMYRIDDEHADSYYLNKELNKRDDK